MYYDLSKIVSVWEPLSKYKDNYSDTILINMSFGFGNFKSENKYVRISKCRSKLII